MYGKILVLKSLCPKDEEVELQEPCNGEVLFNKLKVGRNSNCMTETAKCQVMELLFIGKRFLVEATANQVYFPISHQGLLPLFCEGHVYHFLIFCPICRKAWVKQPSVSSGI